MNKITVGELARRFGRDTSTIRRWEREGRIPPARRDPLNGHRYWSETEVEELRRRLGFANED